MLAIFQKLGYHKIFQKNNKKNNNALLFLTSITKNEQPFSLLPRIFFLHLVKTSQSSVSLFLSAINCNHKPSLKVCTTCCKSSQNTSFSSLCYLLQNQAIKTIVLKPSMGVNLGQKYYTSRDV